MLEPLSQCCALPALTERSLLSLRDISPFHGESPLSGEPLFALSLGCVKLEDTAQPLRQASCFDLRDFLSIPIDELGGIVL